MTTRRSYLSVWNEWKNLCSDSIREMLVRVNRLVA